MKGNKTINEYKDCQDCKYCKVDHDAHHSYLYCDKCHGGVDKNTGLANNCEDYKSKLKLGLI